MASYPNLTHLLNDFEALGSFLRGAVDGEAWLDAYLLAAGMNQIAEDWSHSSPYPLDEAASLLRGDSSRGARLAASACVSAGATARRLRSRAGQAELRRWQLRCARLVDDLADVICANKASDNTLASGCRSLADGIALLPPRLLRMPVRMPACFHGFDQRPEDLKRLAEQYLGERAPAREGPVLVVGVRTSGAYLAPLIAAFLRGSGCPEARVLTIRPGQEISVQERAAVTWIKQVGGEALVTDDPPVTGSSLSAAAAELERSGLDRTRIVMMLALMEASAPARLAAYRSVVLGPEDWSVVASLRPWAVRAELDSLLAGELRISAVEALPLNPSAGGRGHHRGLYRVGGVDPRTGVERHLRVLATGVGLGYFGAHALMVAEALSAFSPRVFGLRHGLLYREWLPAERQLDGSAEQLAPGIAEYVTARREALPVHGDPSLSQRGERPAWEVAGVILGDRFGRGAPVARVLGVDAAARRLLKVRRASLADGATEVGRWFSDDEGSDAVLKTDLTDRTHWRLGLACFDSAFDLAGVGALSPDGELARRVRHAWRERTGEEVDPERWLLYELAHLWATGRARPDREAEIRRAGARALQRYFASLFLADLERPEDGPLCALDIDGVLETELIDWPSLTRASAAALRALIAHRYRPVPVTGRGFVEVRDRCQAYGLAGGVGEYGSVVYVSHGGRTVSLVSEPAAAALGRLRAHLGEDGDIRLDPGYRHAVRAYRVRAGRRAPLAQEEVAACLSTAGADGLVRAIAGDSQTDFVDADVDKGVGLEALAGALGAGREDPEVALAVGDTRSDAPMLRLARVSFVPGHTPAGLIEGSAKRVGKPYQQGLALAVSEILGHPPGGCARCRMPNQEVNRSLLLDLLSIGEGGRGRIPGDAARAIGRLAIGAAVRRFTLDAAIQWGTVAREGEAGTAPPRGRPGIGRRRRDRGRRRRDVARRPESPGSISG